MTPRQKKLLSQIATEALRNDWETAFDGKSYGNKHLLRVNKIIKLLLKKISANNFIALTGGWVHDVSLAYGDDSNAKEVRTVTRKFLQKFSLTREEIDLIAECAYSHETGFKNISLEAKIVHDADVIDKSGFLGFIRHIWKTTNLIKKNTLSTPQDLESIISHLFDRESNLFLSFSKQIVTKRNRELNNFINNRKQSLLFMASVSKYAIGGVIADKIAELVAPNLERKYAIALRKQIDVIF